MRHFIGKIKNGGTLYVDLIQSPAAVSISQQPYLLALLKEMATHAKITGTRPAVEIDMGRAIGNVTIVETNPNDTIVYARRLRSEIYGPYVKAAKPTSTQHLSARLKRDAHGDYELLDVWTGTLYPPLPGSQEAEPGSLSFWKSHAFILSRETIQVRTLTKVCPY